MHEELDKAKRQEAAGEKGRKRGKTVLRFILAKRLVNRVLFWLAIAFLMYVLSAVLITRSKGEIPNLFGYQLYVVESGSMSPTLKIGAVILSRRPADAGTLNINDIVTFRMTNGSMVTHRIIEVLRDGTNGIRYRTKGDNPINSPDPELLDPDRVIAVLVAKIPLT